MDDYDYLKKSALRLKGNKKRKHKSRHKHRELQEASTSEAPDEAAKDADEHGGWWRADKIEHVQGDIAIEFLGSCYAKAMGDGSIVLGQPHPPGEGPEEEEIFTVVSASSNQIALKSGFGRYLNVDSKGRLMGLSEAIAEPESFLPVFEDEKLAMSAFNDCFIGPDIEAEDAIGSQPIVAKSKTVTNYEIINIRITNNPSAFTKKKQRETTNDGAGTLYETELNHLKKYQSHGQKYYNMKEDKKVLKKARVGGELYEALLDKREKSKSDKYCK